MKRLVTALAILLLIPSLVMAAGSCVVTSKELVSVQGVTQRIYITLTCTGDGTIADYTFTPATQGVRGWYLYNVTTNPGTNAPTNLYDITLVSNGEDVAGGLLANRSSTATETVVVAPATLGYHMTDQSIAITFANQTASPSVIVMTLRFTSN